MCRCCSQRKLAVLEGYQVWCTLITSGNTRRSSKLHKLSRVYVRQRSALGYPHCFAAGSFSSGAPTDLRITRTLHTGSFVESNRSNFRRRGHFALCGVRLDETYFSLSIDFFSQRLLWLVVRVGLVTISIFGDVLHIKGVNEAAAWTSVVRAVHPVCFDL